MTFICVPIFVEDALSAAQEGIDAREAGADLIEWRVDVVADDVGLIDGLVRESPLPCIVTCRSRDEGGEYDGDEQQRISLLEHIGLHARPRFIDIELSSFEKSANLRQKVKLAIQHPEQLRELDSTLVLSHHDFNGRPADLMRRLARMAAEPACGVIKIAWMARSLRDNLEAFEILRARHKPTIALCMGSLGLMSRVLAPKFGALLTFACLRDSSATAPGQPTVCDLIETYRFRAIGPATKVYGVIGWPVEHSRSPAIHNAAFERTGFDGVYLPLPVAPDELAFRTTLEALIEEPTLTFRGASVTIPHKTHLLEYVRQRGGKIDSDARYAGAANTLIVGEDGSLEARNTDVSGIVESVTAAMEIGEDDLRDRRIAVIGAGGMARAAVAGLAGRGATVVIHHREFDKARRLADEFTSRAPSGPGAFGKVVAARIEKLCGTCCDVIINATPVGMTGGPDPQGLPLPVDAGATWLDHGPLVVETVYAPQRTPLIEHVSSRGGRTLGGLDLLQRQAYHQFRAWTGSDLDLKTFRAGFE
ncbi:MAG: type I 3-dehydroquinate dehydratase [Phycisphaerales bacterium]|nr:type I 3-dehydroquinate dehydratase [Phycisphaerales bacterium]